MKSKSPFLHFLVNFSQFFSILITIPWDHIISHPNLLHCFTGETSIGVNLQKLSAWLKAENLPIVRNGSEFNLADFFLYQIDLREIVKMNLGSIWRNRLKVFIEKLPIHLIGDENWDGTPTGSRTSSQVSSPLIGHKSTKTYGTRIIA